MSNNKNEICKKCNVLGFFIDTDKGTVCMYCGTPIDYELPKEKPTTVYTESVKKPKQKEKPKKVLKSGQLDKIYKKVFGR